MFPLQEGKCGQGQGFCHDVHQFIPRRMAGGQLAVCDILVYKKYVFGHSHNQNIFLIYICSSTVPGSQPLKPFQLLMR